MLGTATLHGYGGWVVLVVVGSVILLSGVVIIFGRYFLTKNEPPGAIDTTLVRSWIAIALIAGLLLFCGVAFAIDDAPLRNTLFGGLVASVGAAIAFYFSSKGADQARQDLMNAALGTTEVPKLEGLTVSAARAAMGKTPLQLTLTNPNASDGDEVIHQQPPAGTEVAKGSKVSVDTPTPAAETTAHDDNPAATPGGPST
jgi:hypothetical protein